MRSNGIFQNGLLALILFTVTESQWLSLGWGILSIFWMVLGVILLILEIVGDDNECS